MLRPTNQTNILERYIYLMVYKLSQNQRIVSQNKAKPIYNLKWIREYTTISHIKIMVFVLPTIAHVESGRVRTNIRNQQKKHQRYIILLHEIYVRKHVTNRSMSTSCYYRPSSKLTDQTSQNLLTNTHITKSRSVSNHVPQLLLKIYPVISQLQLHQGCRILYGTFYI